MSFSMGRTLRSWSYGRTCGAGRRRGVVVRIADSHPPSRSPLAGQSCGEAITAVDEGESFTGCLSSDGRRRADSPKKLRRVTTGWQESCEKLRELHRPRGRSEEHTSELQS